jgi:FAD/FMN-containing dehydrogenase
VVALPAGSSDVAAIVGHASEASRVVAPHWLDGDDLSRDWIYVSLERLKDIEEVAPADLMAVVGAGVTIAELGSALDDRGLYWPVADVAAPDEMLGDVVSRAPGNWTLRGNLARRYVLALEAVLGDGSVLGVGSRTVKCVTGYDLKQLFTGSCGTLGIVTQLTLRLEAAANREAVRERYRSEFEALERLTGDPATDRAGVRAASAQEEETAAGSLAVLERLKRELDPHAVLPPVSVARGDHG